jgi:hypothetical protein
MHVRGVTISPGTKAQNIHPQASIISAGFDLINTIEGLSAQLIVVVVQ